MGNHGGQDDDEDGSVCEVAGVDFIRTAANG